MNAFTVIAVGGTLVLVGNYLYGINKSQYKIALVATGRVQKISVSGVVLRVQYNIKNPTAATMRMSAPLIKISVNGKQVATSNMQTTDIPEESRDGDKIVIRANTETGAIASELIIPWIALAGVAPDLITRFKNPDGKNKISLKVETLCRIFTMVGSFPYESVSTIKV
jgi:DNA-directed RNA polymerase subunit K/omega